MHKVFIVGEACRDLQMVNTPHMDSLASREQVCLYLKEMKRDGGRLATW